MCLYAARYGALWGAVGPAVGPGASPRRGVPAEPPEAPRVVAARPVEQRHVIIAAVRVRLHVELPEAQLHHLGGFRFRLGLTPPTAPPGTP